MTNDEAPRRDRDDVLKPIDELNRGGVDEDDTLLGGDERDPGRDHDLPEHEIDEDRTVGGGILGAGGTAIDRGTGTLGGQAQGPDRRPDDRIDNPSGFGIDSDDMGAGEADRALGHDR